MEHTFFETLHKVKEVLIENAKNYVPEPEPNPEVHHGDVIVGEDQTRFYVRNVTSSGEIIGVFIRNDGDYTQVTFPFKTFQKVSGPRIDFTRIN